MMVQGKGITAKRGARFCFRRERDMSAIGDLWSLSVASPFTTGSVQMTKAELVTTAAGIPNDVVGAEPFADFQREQV